LVKACRGAAAFPGYLSLGADTVVVLGGRTLGKPRDAAEAREMLAALSGRAHEVYTAFGLAASFPSPRRKIAVFWLEVVRSEVYFRRLSATEIAEYVATGAPLDKAGAYGIQDPSHKLVERVRGSYYNVVGLPLRQVLRALRTVESRCP
jgi:septum formation protein